MKDYKFSVEPGETIRIGFNGFLHAMVYYAQGDFQLALNDGALMDAKDGDHIAHPTGAPINSVSITNPTAGTIKGTLRGSMQKLSRSVASEVKVSSGATTLGNAVDVNITDVATQIAPTNSTREYVTIYAGDKDLWIGGDATIVAGTVGGKVGAFGRVTLQNKGAVWGIRSAGQTGLAGYQEDLT